jgi:uncharacterized protein
MRLVRFIALLLVIIGAINWGLWGFFQYDLIADIFGGPSTAIARLVYALIGLSGLYSISFFCCGSGKCSKCHCTKCTCGKDREQK